jgi:SM-20-related protein
MSFSPDVRALDTPGVLVHDGWLGRPTAEAVRGELEALVRAGALRPAGVSRSAAHRVDADTRGDTIAWLAPETAGPAVARLLAGFDALREVLNREAYLGLARAEIQLARYPGGGARYRRHRDAFPGRSNRRLTALYYLNPAWRPADGGLLRCQLEAGGPLDVEPIADRLVCFLSERVEHEVLPAYAPRLAVTAWFYGRDHLPV